MRTDHRPWPIPDKPWIMKQSWHSLLFAHWPVSAEELRKWIPAPLQLDTFDGSAWIGVVPFYMSGIRMRYLPPVPSTSAFAEINVRTYVTLDDKPGVYFFSLDADSRLAVQTARMFFKLPYYDAQISCETKEKTVHYKSERKGADVNCQFSGTFQPVSDVYYSKAGDLDHWLTERYCLYTADQNDIYRCEINHEPWPLQRAEAHIEENTMVAPYDISLPDQQPLCHYSDRIDVRVWGLEKAANRL